VLRDLLINILCENIKNSKLIFFCANDDFSFSRIRGPYDRRLSQLLAKEGQNLVEVCFPPEGGDVSVKGPKAHASEVKKVYEKISEIYRKIYDQKKDIKEVNAFLF
jgi:hypothetical protein